MIEPSLTLPPLDNSLLTQVAQDGTRETVIGHSAEGHDLVIRRFGSGERVLMLVGGIHGGWEGNTVTLMQQLIDHFTATPADVLPGMTILINPVANPDGLAYGRIPRGRFNGDDVDLNRNWACDWSGEAYWREERVNAGIGSFTEPETVALANFILQVRPAGLLFFHSAAGGVFAGNCNGDHGSAALAAIFGKAAGYSYDKPFTAYGVSGTASDWADQQGIPAADVELLSPLDSEYERNLKGILALEHWLVGN